MAKASRRRRFSLKGSISVLLLVLLIGAAYYLYENYLKEEEEIPIPEGSVAVYYIDVGQGDAALIVAPTGETMLIDAGIDDAAANFLIQHNYQTLDYAVFTHFDSDHIGGGDEVLEALEVKNILTPDYEPDGKLAQALLEDIEAEGATRLVPGQSMKIALGEVSFEILSDSEIVDEGKNDDSIVMLMTFGKTKFMFSGDAEKKRETQVLADYGNKIDADVMKAGHHGASNANNKDFVDAVTPDIVVISCGEGNKYGHPREDALDRLDDHAETILRTDLHGTVTLFSDGETITYETEKNPAATTSVGKLLALPIDLRRLSQECLEAA